MTLSPEIRSVFERCRPHTCSDGSSWRIALSLLHVLSQVRIETRIVKANAWMVKTNVFLGLPRACFCCWTVLHCKGAQTVWPAMRISLQEFGCVVICSIDQSFAVCVFCKKVHGATCPFLVCVFFSTYAGKSSSWQAKRREVHPRLENSHFICDPTSLCFSQNISTNDL